MSLNEDVLQLYNAPGIEDYEDVHLLTLREHCAEMEAKIQDILPRLSEHDRHILESYLDIRDSLEIEAVKAALRWGKQHYL